jgi:hypothetical protein
MPLTSPLSPMPACPAYRQAGGRHGEGGRVRGSEVNGLNAFILKAQIHDNLSKDSFHFGYNSFLRTGHGT